MRILILLLFLIGVCEDGVGRGDAAPMELAPTAQDACAGLLPTRLILNQGGRVMLDDGIGLVLHEAAGLASPIVGTLVEGTLFIVAGSLACADNLLWQQVRLADGREGFLSEGNSLRYFAEPYAVGTPIFREDAVNNLILHDFVDTQGNFQSRAPFPIVPRIGSAGDLWQSTELVLANEAIQDRRTTCPERVENMKDIASVTFTDNQRQFYPTPNGEKMLVFRSYHLTIPNCDNQAESYGTTYVSVLDANGEQVIFPYSQHSAPPPTEFCQIPTVAGSEQRAFVDDVVWSPDGVYAALSMRYLGNNTNFPCAFYHIFLVNTRTLEITYLDSGRRLTWTDSGRRLQYIRVERNDPNQLGIERMFNVRPDGTDKVEIGLPAEVTFLPDVLDVSHQTLPILGEDWLVCVGRVFLCNEVKLWSLRDGLVSSMLPMPLSLGENFLGVYGLAAGTQLLWVNRDGTAFLQSVADSRTVQEIQIGQGVTAVFPTIGGFGVVFRTVDNRYFYMDAVSATLLEVRL